MELLISIKFAIEPTPKQRQVWESHFGSDSIPSGIISAELTRLQHAATNQQASRNLHFFDCQKHRGVLTIYFKGNFPSEAAAVSASQSLRSHLIRNYCSGINRGDEITGIFYRLRHGEISLEKAKQSATGTPRFATV